MSIALDVGTSKLRSLRREGAELVGRTMPAAFALVADEQSARDLLSKAELTFATGQGELALIGEAAFQYAATFHTTALPLLPGGIVPGDDPPARQLLGTLIEALLPEGAEPGTPCGLVIPAASMADKASSEFISRLVRMRGYEPAVLGSSHALALASLSAEGFTGISVCIGAGSSSMSLVHRGRQLVIVSEPLGTDSIDSRIAAEERRYIHDAAGDRYLDSGSVRRQRESLGDSLTRPASDFSARVAAGFRELIEGLVDSFANGMQQERLGRFEAPLTVICGGGATRSSGIATLLTNALAAAELPLAIGTTKIAPADEYAIARGALIFAELEYAAVAAA